MWFQHVSKKPVEFDGKWLYQISNFTVIKSSSTRCLIRTLYPILYKLIDWSILEYKHLKSAITIYISIPVKQSVVFDKIINEIK